ncbi:DUF5336 domain-containing protein [Pseudonocardia oroxyli]|uniref:Uncharacterized protein n=1 Tax=Pseudonocardia oroxyli TaxID=366584 RepID=A0A1G7GSC9_PSEOR|nr:DUF5336 domain-containing protein [Pseudonocardia oroxyli]SDE91034.1 hypothetical protein SAMN05216377_102442 [Pseudonocardia oroxyli]
MSESPNPERAALAGPARTMVMAGTGLAVVVWLLGFFSVFPIVQVAPALLLGGGALAAVALLPRADRFLIPAAVLAAVGFLLLVQLGVLGSQVAGLAGGSLGGIEIAALVLAFLEAAVLVGAVLLEAGVVSLPAPKPAAPPQPYYGGQYPPPQGGGYQQQPTPYSYGYPPQQQPYGGYPQQPGYGPPQGWGGPAEAQAGYGQPPAAGWSGQQGQPGQQSQPGQPGQQSQPGQPAPVGAYGQPGAHPQPGPQHGAPPAPPTPPAGQHTPTEVEQTRIEPPAEGRHSGGVPDSDRTTTIAVDPERRDT